MARTHRMGLRGLLIAGFLVAAPLVAVFQGPLQDRFETLFKRDTPKPASVASSETWIKPTDDAGGFRPVIRGGDDPASGETASTRPRFPDEPEQPQSERVADRRRADDPRLPRSGRSATDPDSPFPSDDGAVARRRPDRKDFDEIQTDFQNRDDLRESPKRERRRTELDDPVAEDHRTAEGKPAGGKPAGRAHDDRHDLTVAEDDVMEKAGGGKAAASDPLKRPYTRLRDLGATSSRLETWGAEGERYRFQCRVATDADGTEARHFEATDEQPLRAIEKVVHQVEAWQSQRR